MRNDPLCFDLQALKSWAANGVSGLHGHIRVDKFATGQSNPTYRLRTEERDIVLRRKPPGMLLKSAHAIDREFRVQAALAKTNVPVARMLALCEDENIIGSTFYLMEFVAGRTFEDPQLPTLGIAQRGLVVGEMNRVLADIHSVDINAVGLADFGPHGNYFRRQIDRWSGQYQSSATEVIPAMNALIDWLDRNVPADDGRISLVHGDFRIDNLLFSPEGSICVAVLDWELSTIGHPFADLANVIMQWSRPIGSVGRGLAGVDRSRLGLPEDQAFIDAYCARLGLASIEHFGFYLAFCFFRMAAILQGVKRRALDGNASDPVRALELGTLIPGYASSGLEATQTV